MRLAILIAFGLCATPALGGECEDFLTRAIHDEGIAAAVTHVKDAAAGQALTAQFATLERDVGAATLAQSKLTEYDNLAMVANSTAIDAKFSMIAYAVYIKRKADLKTALQVASASQAELERLLTVLCGNGDVDMTAAVATVPGAILELRQSELPASNDHFTFKEGAAHEKHAGGTADFTWTLPPRLITANGFDIKLTVDAHYNPNSGGTVGLQIGGEGFRFDPDPAEVWVKAIGGMDEGNSGTFHVTPTVPGGYAKLWIGPAYAPPQTFEYGNPRSN